MKCILNRFSKTTLGSGDDSMAASGPDAMVSGIRRFTSGTAVTSGINLYPGLWTTGRRRCETGLLCQQCSRFEARGALVATHLCFYVRYVCSEITGICLFLVCDIICFVLSTVYFYLFIFKSVRVIRGARSVLEYSFRQLLRSELVLANAA